jgi:succinate dehydrogenase / fumarate reductase, cytochrome b subunit
LSSKPRETANVGAGLWKATGMWAWLLFRISGVILAFYLLVHIIVISTGHWSADSHTLNNLMKMFDTPALIVLDLALVVAVLYHALNGVRIILMDFGIGVQRHKLMFWTAMAVVVICFVLFAYVAFSYIATGKGLFPNTPAVIQ